MERKFILRESGIGDTIHFISHFYREFDYNDKIYMDFYHPNIQEFRSDEKDYYEFMKKLIHFISPNNITVVEGLKGDLISMSNLFKHYNSSHYFKFLNLRNKLNIIADNEKIILHTKVRQLHYYYYDIMKADFYNVLNSGSKQIILMGEKEIEYEGKEYRDLGNRRVYSIYEDAIKFIKPEKILDLTVPKLGTTTPNIEKLIEDMNIMAGHKNICFGSAGNVSICCCVGDTLSYSSDPEYAWFTVFLDNNQVYFKYSKEEFLKEVLNYIN